MMESPCAWHAPHVHMHELHLQSSSNYTEPTCVRGRTSVLLSWPLYAAHTLRKTEKCSAMDASIVPVGRNTTVCEMETRVCLPYKRVTISADSHGFEALRAISPFCPRSLA